RDLAGDAPDLLQAREVGIVHRVAAPGRAGIEARQHGLAARAVARHHDEPRPHRGEALRGDLTDTGGGAGHDNDFAVHHALLSAPYRETTAGIAYHVAPT